MREKKYNDSLSLKDYNLIFYQRLNYNRNKNFLINLNELDRII